jgi:hypothetical protein
LSAPLDYFKPLSDSSTRQRTQTRERILEAAEAVFADNGYHEALVDEIGKKTSMSKGISISQAKKTFSSL